MDEIENYNCEGMCCQAHCDEKYTHFLNRELYGLKLHFAFCKNHSEIVEQFIWRTKSDKKIKGRTKHSSFNEICCLHGKNWTKKNEL